MISLGPPGKGLGPTHTLAVRAGPGLFGHGIDLTELHRCRPTGGGTGAGTFFSMLDKLSTDLHSALECEQRSTLSRSPWALAQLEAAGSTVECVFSSTGVHGRCPTMDSEALHDVGTVFPDIVCPTYTNLIRFLSQVTFSLTVSLLLDAKNRVPDGFLYLTRTFTSCCAAMLQLGGRTHTDPTVRMDKRGSALYLPPHLGH